MLYLMRMAIDKYLDLTGHIYADEAHTFFNYRRDQDRLEEVMDDLKSRQPNKLGNYHVREMVDKVGNLVALSVASVPDDEGFDSYLQSLKKTGVEIRILKKYVEIITSPELLKGVKDLFYPESIDWESMKHLRTKYKDGAFSESTWGKKDLELQYKDLLAGIHSEGRSYFPGKTYWAKQEYEKYWATIKTKIVERVFKFREDLSNIKQAIMSSPNGKENMKYHREIWADVVSELQPID